MSVRQNPTAFLGSLVPPPPALPQVMGFSLCPAAQLTSPLVCAEAVTQPRVPWDAVSVKMDTVWCVLGFWLLTCSYAMVWMVFNKSHAEM